MQAAAGRLHSADEQVSLSPLRFSYLDYCLLNLPTPLSRPPPLPPPPLLPRRFNSMHDSMQKQHVKDVALTKAKVRKLELQVESLQRALDEKVSTSCLPVHLSLPLPLPLPLSLSLTHTPLSVHPQGREKEGLTQLCDELLAQINTP